MRRGKPLQSRSQPSPGTGLQRRTRIKPRIYITRRALVETLLAERPWCEIRWDAGCQRRATDVHEPGMRSRGADICNPDECTTACRHCHDEVHRNPAEATRRGWMIPSRKQRAA